MYNASSQSRNRRPSSSQNFRNVDTSGRAEDAAINLGASSEMSDRWPNGLRGSMRPGRVTASSCHDLGRERGGDPERGLSLRWHGEISSRSRSTHKNATRAHVALRAEYIADDWDRCMNVQRRGRACEVAHYRSRSLRQYAAEQARQFRRWYVVVDPSPDQAEVVFLRARVTDSQ